MDNNKFKDRKNRPAPREEDDSGLIIGRNPVTEALKAGLPIDTVYIDPAAGGSAGHIRALAKERGIVVKDADDRKLSKMCRGASHQGVAAVGACAEYADRRHLQGGRGKGRGTLYNHLRRDRGSAQSGRDNQNG